MHDHLAVGEGYIQPKIASALSIFQEIMNNIFGDFDFVLVYTGDILILQREKTRQKKIA